MDTFSNHDINSLFHFIPKYSLIDNQPYMDQYNNNNNNNNHNNNHSNATNNSISKDLTNNNTVYNLNYNSNNSNHNINHNNNYNNNFHTNTNNHNHNHNNPTLSINPTSPINQSPILTHTNNNNIPIVNNLNSYPTSNNNIINFSSPCFSGLNIPNYNNNYNSYYNSINNFNTNNNNFNPTSQLISNPTTTATTAASSPQIIPLNNRNNNHSNNNRNDSNSNTNPPNITSNNINIPFGNNNNPIQFATTPNLTSATTTTSNASPAPILFDSSPTINSSPIQTSPTITVPNSPSFINQIQNNNNNNNNNFLNHFTNNTNNIHNNNINSNINLNSSNDVLLNSYGGIKNQDIPWFCNVNEQSPSSGGYPLPNVFSSFQTPLFRNFYHQIEFFIPDLAIQKKYQGSRIYISDSIGYSGNAKKFINSPQSFDEVALILEGQVLDVDFNPIPQCTCCKDYFQSRFYFATNPQCKEKLVLVKSNVTCHVSNGSFPFQIKIMCCSKHHNNNSLVLHLWLRDVQTKRIILSSVLSSYIKQWKRSKSTSILV